ncbi:hypothetical protein Oter_0586 [Opitutus terrae PB90-1]|uniref:Uncharacterized protein n=2 Tax=Opitutus terrae TaxID=107709 RepID=B1ZSL9_OPITP|nr:hypothetical protein Oter_0586 [Opitutus terrae PB90-1]
MRTVFWAALLVLPLTTTEAASSGGLLGWILGRPELKVVTVTDLTPEGALRPTASPTRPVYYIAASAGFRDFGAIFAGEKTIAPRQVTATMIKVLAKQGYLPADSDHPPSVILAWTWGTMNADYFSVDGTYRTQLNRYQLLRFMGGKKLGMRTQPDLFHVELAPGLTRSSPAEETLSAAASDHLFVAKVAAYDFEAARQNRIVQLWSTRISAPSRGFWLPEALPPMLVMASPFFGRETAQPVWIDASEKFRPEVILGDPRFVDYVERGESAVIDLPKPRAK